MEIDITRPLPPLIQLDSHHQLLVVEDMSFCPNCDMLGHDRTYCPKITFDVQPESQPEEGTWRQVRSSTGQSFPLLRK